MKDNRILVDTSAWIWFMKIKAPQPLVQFLNDALDANLVATNGLIIAELLQGARTDKEYGDLKESLSALHYLPFIPHTFEQAGRIGFQLRRKGLSIPTTDLLIAQTAIENRCVLLHSDKHFETIAQFFPLQTTQASFKPAATATVIRTKSGRLEPR